MSHTADSSNESDDGKHPQQPQIGDDQMAPAYMTAVMRRQFLQEMVKAMPEAVQNRITVLKNLQLQELELESEFFKEVFELEKKYHEKYQPLNIKREEIINGTVEPPKEEPKWKQDNEEDGEDEDDADNKEAGKQDFSAVLNKIKDLPADTKGIPNFWLTIFRNTELLSQMVQEHDVPALKALNDIKIRYEDDFSYILEFHFDKNDYFTNSILTKQYFLKFAIDEDYPFGFDGPEIYKCKGCVINWKTKMNLTVKTIRKKQKHKEHGAVRTLVKTVPNDSFFNFFDAPEVSDNKEDMDEDHQELLATDFEIGHFLRSQLIPHAVLYFTGDILDDDDDDDEEFDEEDDEDDEDEGRLNRTGGGGGNRKAKPNDCPNQ